MKSRQIAIIGLAGRYPGGADSIDQLWANLKAGVDGITDLPADRWDRGYMHPDRSRKGRTYTLASGYLKGVENFDADFFGISPREAEQMDPQHRLLLELAWEALESASLVPGSLAGTKTGVFVGLSSRDYDSFKGDQGVNAYTNIGLSLSLASNRISYVLDLKGPSFTVDTACSSGMVAFHQACLSIDAGESEMALVGGANLMLSPTPYIGFAKASMLSPAGRCTSFDANGAGYVRAEGGGILVLKPLEAAERDGDPILAVVVNTGVNSDGRTVGIALPNVNAQEALLRKVYGEAGIDPREVAYLEAHGTGTAVGDPIECEAIARVLGGAQRGEQPLFIGSIKSNIGHLEPAAGIAGLTKAILALKHREVPANLHFKTPNPKIDFEGWKLKVVSEHTPLPQTAQPVLVGVNSFGFGGTNAHAVLQEYRPRQPQPAAPAPQADPSGWKDLLMLSGQSEGALAAVVAQWLPLVEQAAGMSAAPAAAEHWQQLRANALHKRTHHAHRLVVHAGNAAEALQALREHQAGHSSPHFATGRAPASGRARVAWVYSGNGPQWWAMGRELMAADATYRNAVQAVDAIFSKLSGWSLVDELMRDEATSRMSLTEVAQPTLFALQVGLSEVLRAAGLQPDAVFGHSVGEAAAAWASGALSLEQATTVIHQRSQAQAATAGLGRMAALGVPVAEAQRLIAEIGGFLEVAAINSPGAVTVAGDPAQLEVLCQRLTEAGKFARMLALDYAFHTRAMDGIKAGLLTGLHGLQPGATRVPFVSTVEAKVLDGSALDAEYWWRNVREPVAFQGGVQHAMEALQVNAFIEVGPHPVLRDYLLQCAKARGTSAPVLTTLRRPRPNKAEPEVATMRQTVCAAHAAGLSDPHALSAPPTRVLPLPLYPWQRSRHWRGDYALPEVRAAFKRDHPLLGWRLSSNAPAWEVLAELPLLPYLEDHKIQRAVLFPAAGYIEMALASARQLFGDGPTQMEDSDILKPLVLPEGPAPVLGTQTDPADGTYEIRSRPSLESPEAMETTLHNRGRLTKAEAAHQPAAIDIAALWDSLPVEVSAEAHYSECLRRGMQYGPAFQVVQAIRLPALDSTEPRRAAAWIELPEAFAQDLASYRSHPALLDGALQVLISLLAQHESRPCAYIPVRVDRLRWFAPLPRRLFCQVRLQRESARSGSAEFALYDETGACVLILDSTRFQKADFGALVPMRLVDHWRRDGQGRAQVLQPIELPNPQAVARSLQPPQDEPAALLARLEALVGLYAAEALQTLHGSAGMDAAAPFSAAALQRRAKVLPEHGALLRALLEMARADGWLASADGSLRFAAAARPSAAAQWRELMLQAPGLVSELMLLAQAAEQLPALLRGEAEATLKSTSGRTLPAFDALLDTAPFRAAAHRQAAQALQALVAQWPAGRPLRVLELHGGAGGLTAAVLPVLPLLRTDYALSERTDEAVESLGFRFGQGAQVRTLKIDLADPASFAAHRHGFDLLLCSDGLVSAGVPVEQALAQARELLVPGGWMLLLAARAQRLATLLFGQDPAWWPGEDSPLRQDEAWAALWPQAGWAQAERVGAGHTPQLLWLAQAGTAAPDDAAATVPAPAAQPAARDWLLWVDASEAGERFGNQLAQALEQRGQRVRCQRLHAGAAPQGDSVAVDDVATFGQWLLKPLNVVVNLAGLASEAQSAEDQMALQQLRCVPVISLVQALRKEGDDMAARAKPRVQLLTRGAFMGPGGSAAMNPAQVPLWGLARVLSNEHSELAPKMVDLHAPLDAALAQRLADELLCDDGETEVLLDNAGRWMHRLKPTHPMQLARAAESLPAVPAPPQLPAVRLEAAAQGGLDALFLRGVPRVAPAKGQVEVAVRAAGLNFRDVLWAMNMLPEEAVEQGFSGATIGMECAGEVVAVGPDAGDFKVGDRVIGFASGCFASHVTTSARALARMPEGMDFAAAATVPTTFLTAMYALDHLARLQPGERVLIHGAAGGVGLAAVQIAKQMGAVVFGTAGNDDKRRLLRLYGVDHALDSRSLAFADDVMRITDGQGVDVVLNSLAGEAITKNLQILRPFGRLLEIGKRDFYANSRIGLRPFRINLSYFGIDADTLLIERPDLAGNVFAKVAQLFREGKLHALPFQALPIERASQAFRLMQQSRHVGKIVVTLPGAGEPLPHALPAAWQAHPEGAYLVTGGLGGFGLATAKWLVAQGARNIALMSRRGPSTDEARAGIAAMQAAGARVCAYTGDVSKGADVERVLAEIRAAQGPLRGLVHSAMVLDDAPVMLLNGERLQGSLQPKLQGAWHLHQLTKNDPLDTFVVYSSATTVVGNPGQGNYVAANLYLESLVQWRRAQGLPGLAMCWGGIADVGVLTRIGGLDESVQQRSGMAVTSAEQCLAELGRMLGCSATSVSVAQFNVQRLGELLAGTRTPRFSALAPVGGADAGVARETLAERIANTPAEERRTVVVETLRELLGRILGLPATKIDLERALPDLGLDSLMAVELAQNLEREVGRPVSVMQMIQAASGLAVADLLLAGFEQTANG